MKALQLLLIALLIQTPFSVAHAQTKHKKTHQVNKKLYVVTIPKDSTCTDIQTYLPGLSHPVTFIIKVNKGKTLLADIHEKDGPGNIRINQVGLPDGSMSGPYGKSIQCPIARVGTYKLIVGGSNMQGDDWHGPFTLHVAIQ